MSIKRGYEELDFFGLFILLTAIDLESDLPS